MRKSVLISMLMLAALLSGCKREPNPEGPVLTISLEVPAPAMVKATVPASDVENAIHSIKIWVFNSNSTHALVTSLELDASHPAEDFPQAGSVKRYSLPVSWDFALSKPRPTVDVFVLANAAAIGLDQTLWAEKTNAHEVSSYDEVNGALFGDGSGAATNYFSPALKVNGVSEEIGLPMSGIAKGLVISGEEPTLSLSSVSLERCVSKIRFLFSQVLTVADPSEQETFRIDRIDLNGYSVPKQEYVFAESAPAVRNDYYSSSTLFELPGVATVNSSERPEIYVYGGAGEDGPSYERKIKDALAANEITSAGSYYIRESGRPLSGIIHYTVTKGTGGSATERHEARSFTMPAGSFPRNHTWTVYAYYVANRTLQLTVSVLPWDKSDYDIDFSTSSLMVTGKLKVLDNSVASVSRIGTSDEYNVTLKYNSPAIAYLYVATPKGGKLQVLMNGDTNAFDVWFTDEPNKSRETTIDPDKNSGRIDLSIYRKEGYSGPTTGKTITLGFVAYTPDGDREIEGASECIDQIFNFILP